ncbi:uncharacterized protein LOC108153742 [Drosophila miranda]|uniref:uncharacterized protein LOC108153742 n=1 Tax=Drosophila miranda TaxID=7229 RepID=UPI0007E7443C|nr:uncharacterized protein LOC108153742 [Drosophila miranda]XP_017139372.1 uncharacterized protein LOC108153742 [Drosophila miranda]XP_017139381.1 uncharacterized protein LOC108153742 [Drosophila miranda]XP_017139389.1 uncharacterized protein LOC108153742 [Drosophila miranda]
MEDASEINLEVISESDDSEAVTDRQQTGDVTHRDVQVSASENVSEEEGAILPLDPAIVAKQKQILGLLPFIEEVKNAFMSSLTQGQFSRLEALICLVKRDNVTPSTLNKIETIVMKLETKFGEKVRNRQAREASGAASGNRSGAPAQKRLLQKGQAPEQDTALAKSKSTATAAASPQINNQKPKGSGSNTSTGLTKRKEKPSSTAIKYGDKISISSSSSESEDHMESTNRKRNPQSRSTTLSGSKASTERRKSVSLDRPSPANKVAEEPARRSSSSHSFSAHKPRNERKSTAKSQGASRDQKKPEGGKADTSQKARECDRVPSDGQDLLSAIREARTLDREQKQARENANRERTKVRSLQFNASASADLGFSRRSNADQATAKTAFTRQCEADSTSAAAVRQPTPNERHQQQQPPTEPSNGTPTLAPTISPTPPPSLCDRDAARRDRPVSPLSEARKKLAAMLMDKLDPSGAVGTGLPCTLPLASNSMDPRGKNPNYKSHALSAAVSNVLASPPAPPPLPVPPPSVIRDTSPVLPAPPMKASSVWNRIPGAVAEERSMGFRPRNLNSHNAHVRPPHNVHGNQRPQGLPGNETQSSGPAPHLSKYFHPSDPRSMPREATWDPRETRDPRCQNMPRPNHQHKHQHQGYSQGNSTNWQPSSWNGNNNNNRNETNPFNGGGRPSPDPGFLPGPRPNFGGGSFRGGPGGISHRYMPPGGGRGRGGGNYDGPHSYREHREAKAREAAAAAKVAEEQRLADIEKKRQLEAADKQRQQEESDCAAVTLAVTALPERQLDTSYRTVIANGPAKKIDFRIPKKTSTAAAATTKVGQSLGNGKEGESASSCTSPLTNKSCNEREDNDRDKDKDTNRSTDNNKDTPNVESESPRNSPKDPKDNPKPERAEKKNRSKDADKNKNMSKDQDKPKKEETSAAKNANKKKKKKLKKKKDNNQTEKKEQKEAGDKKASSSTPSSLPSSCSTAETIAKGNNSNNKPQIDGSGASCSLSDNVENEPPMVCIPCTPSDKASEGKPTTDKPEIQPEDAASDIDLKNTKTKAGSPLEGKPDNAAASGTATGTATETATAESMAAAVAVADPVAGQKVPPKLSKMKIFLGPNGHSTFLFNDDGSKLLEDFGQKFKANPNGDTNGSEEQQGPTYSRKINPNMRRRNSMAPTASRPLVDRALLFNGSSLMYEDLTEQKRKDEKQSMKARHLANIFEKTSDNCRVSTQNIITGKRRTRGIPECSFNETKLSRNCFGLGQINRSAKATPEEKKLRSITVPQTKPDIPHSKSEADKPRSGEDNNFETDISTKPEATELQTEKTPQPVKRKRGRPPSSPKNAIVQASKRPRLEIEENRAQIEVTDSDEQSVAPTPTRPTPTPPAPPTVHLARAKPRARKRNELEKLNEYLSSMHNGEEVTRATGRRACTLQQVQRRSESLSPSPSPSPLPSRRPSPREIRNVARRGRPCGPRGNNDGINRASTIWKREKPVLKCVVRLRRHPMPIPPQSPKQPTPTPTSAKTSKTTTTTQPKRKEEQKKRNKKTQLNVNSEWNAMSTGAIDCVVCHMEIDKNPIGHYLQYHKENYISRLAPGMLDELREGRGNRLRFAGGDGSRMKYNYVCPFCTKDLQNSSFGNIALHLIGHTGESNTQCSACKQPMRRQATIKKHRKNCVPEAQIVSDPRTSCLPLSLHVCPVCDYVQMGQERRDRHLMKHHRLNEQLIADIEMEKVILCCRPADDIQMKTETETAVPKLISRRSSMIYPKTPKKKICFKIKQRKPGRPSKLSKRGDESQGEEEDVEEIEEDGMPASQEMQEIEVPPLNEDAAAEPILVVNECLLDLDPELEMDLKLLHAQLEEDIEETELLQNESGLQQKSAAAITMVEEKPILAELLPMEVEGTGNEAQVTQDSPAKPSEEEEETVVPAVPVDTHIPDLSVDPLMGIGSDDSGSEMDVDVDVEVDTVSACTAPTPAPGAKDVDDDDKKRVPGDWVDLVETGSQDGSRSQSIFRKFNRYYSRLTNRTGGGVGSGSGGGGPRHSTSRITPADPNELMPEMRPLEPEPEPEPEKAREIQIKPVLSAPTAALAAKPTPSEIVVAAAAAGGVPAPGDTTPMSALTRVENVAYRMRETTLPASAVYCCVYPGCSFLFSNEREGLERHFAIEHPQVSWSGGCFACITQDQTKALLTLPRSIADELHHLAQKHMPAAAPAANPPEQLLPAAKPALPKLRVRRFSGDLLTKAAKQVEQDQIQQQQQQQQQENVSSNQVDVDMHGNVEGDTLANVMLRDLLKATPRPINQLADLNAAGLGEFLCAKPATPPALSPRETETQAPRAADGNANGNEKANEELLYNNRKNTGLQIVTVCHVDEPQNEPAEPQAMPPVLPESLATVNNGHFMVTQSISANHVNICLAAPTAAGSAVAASAAAEKGAPAGAPPTTANRRPNLHLSQDRFRCMAAGCGYCAHTVMCIREHMNFHRFSFGSADYLYCAYCPHVASDVDDYVRHGVLVHGLAPRHELETATTTRPGGELSVSEQIHKTFTQQRKAFTATVPPAVPVSASAPAKEKVQPQLQGKETAPGNPHGGVSLSKVLVRYLEPTGYGDDKLFECPQRTCGARLTSESFVNHIHYHIRSSSSRMDTELVKCRYCRTLETPPMLRQHMLLHHARHNYICSLCLETGTSKDMVIFHVQKCHSEVLGLPNHSFKVMEVSLQEGHAVMAAHSSTVCHVVGVLLPFEQEQLQAMKFKLIRELKLREAGTKFVFRSSEAKLLPSGHTVLTVQLRCAECLYVSSEVVHMQRHLAMHKVQTIGAFVESQRIVQTSPEIPEPSPVKEDVANGAGGQHTVVNPYMLYVPSAGRFVCGALDCGIQLPTQQALIEHMSKEHKYTDVLWCPFCRCRQPSKLSVTKYLKHLLTHKHHVYQCGSCSRCNPDRYSIERHIMDRHPKINVDVVIHRQEVNARLKTTARWIKLPKLSKHPTHNQLICNLCQHMDNAIIKMRAHVEAVHGIKHQYICPVRAPQCSFGANEPVSVIQHILDNHPSEQVQPALIYQRPIARKRQTMGFYCCQCRLAFLSFQRIVAHLKEQHACLCQYKCPHCEISCAQERSVISHMIDEHPDLKGLAICQFERVFTDLPDKLAWAEAYPIEEAQQREQQQQEEDQEEDPDEEENEQPEEQEVQQPPLAVNSRISEVIDLLDSDDETETERVTAPAPAPAPVTVTATANRNVSEPFNESLRVSIAEKDKTLIESYLRNHFYIFCCDHCGFTSRNLMEMKTQHWAKAHAKRSFMFRVQPILMCCQCKSFNGSAKELRDHLMSAHQHKRLVRTFGCDVRRPRECGFCDYNYQNWEDLSSHMEQANHQANDLKNMTDSGLEVLLNLNRSKNGAEYYQKCSLCQKILPDQIAMYHHGQQEHANQGFSFTNVHPLMFRCVYCVFSSQEEMVTLQHMISHFGGFQRCHFCQMDQPGGFQQYIQHCYTNHQERVGRFRQVYTYRVILRFLMQTALQFQNGLIISKNSLLNTRYNSDTLSRQLYEELMALAERPPIPRIHIGLKNTTPIAIQGLQGEPVPKKAKISQRRQTLGPDELIRANPPAVAAVAPSPAAALSPSQAAAFAQRPAVALAQRPAVALAQRPAAAHGRPANTTWSTSFTGTNPTAPLQPPPPAAAKVVAGNQQTTSTAGPQNIIRNLKRRNSVVIFSRP